MPEEIEKLPGEPVLPHGIQIFIQFANFAARWYKPAGFGAIGMWLPINSDCAPVA
jgi:hypothetical protein